MKVEKSLCGEYLNVQMTLDEGELLHSFLEFYTREKLSEEVMSNEEYELARKLLDEVVIYLDENYPTYEEILSVESLIKEFELKKEIN